MIDRRVDEKGKYDLPQIAIATIGVVLLAVAVDYFFPFWARALYYLMAIVVGIVLAPLCWMGRNLWLSIKERKSEKH